MSSIEGIMEAKEKTQIAPEDVVEAASDSENPLHTLFEWDDAVAAKQARLHRAREVMASIC